MSKVSRAEFDGHVRDAYLKLYDPAALRTHPLADFLITEGGRSPILRGESVLDRRLLAVVEDLRPGPHVNADARPWRLYRLLQLRYVEGFSAAEVQRKLAISKSQYYRDHEAALDAAAALLWQGANDDAPSDFMTTAPAASSGVPTSVRPGARSEKRSIEPRPSRSATWRWPVVAAFAILFGAGTLATVQTRSSPAPDQVEPVASSVALRVYAGSGQAGHENGPAAAARFFGPFGLAAEPAGALYVADTGNHRIRKITTTGLVLDVAGTGIPGYLDGPTRPAPFNSPNGVTVGPDGTVYVADAGNFRIRAI